METTKDPQFSLRTVILLASLVLLGLAVRVAHWHPGSGSDDARYMNYAAMMGHGERVTDYDPVQVRPVYLAYLAGWMHLFGFNTTSCAAAGFVVWAGTALLLFALTASLAGYSAGLAAVFLYDFVPVDIIQSTGIYPDHLMTAFALGASLVYFSAMRADTTGRRMLLALVAGILLGLSFSTKQAAVLVGATIGLHLLITAEQKRRWLEILAPMALGGLLVLLAECGVFALWTGDPFFRAHSGVLTNPQTAPPVESRDLKFALGHVLRGIDSLGAYGIYCYLLVGAVLLSVNRRNWACAFPLIWCTAFAVYLSVGSQFLARYQLIAKAPRYFLPVLIVGCALCAMELVHASRVLRIRGIAAAGLAAALVVVSLWATRLNSPTHAPELARALNHLNEKETKNFVVLRSFVRRQPLELREVAGRFHQIDPDAASSPDALLARLEGRGLAVPNVPWFGFGEVNDRLSAPGVPFEKEEIHGPAWPPYKRWFGLGAQDECVGFIYWPRSQPRTR